jgi:YHS domain-containing protein
VKASQRESGKKIVPEIKGTTKKTISVNAGTLKQEAEDPVCKMTVPKGTAITALYNGKQYGFCSEGCKEYFLEKPDKYLAAK